MDSHCLSRLKVTLKIKARKRMSHTGRAEVWEDRQGRRERQER